jgi:hypothetical protein
MKQLTNPPQAGAAVVINENFDALAAGVGLYAEKYDTTTGLVWGYYGGPLSDSVSISDGVTTSLAGSDTVYAVMHRTTGVLTHATTTTNWDNVATYGRVRLFETAASSITSSIDWRFLAGGIFDRSGAAVDDEHYEVDGTPASDDTWGGRAITGVNAGATIAQWEAVYMGSGGEWLLADATDDTTAPAHGIAVAGGTDGNPMTVLPEGIVRNDAWNWTPGGAIFLSTTPGALTQTAPSSTGEIVQRIGWAVSADVAYVSIGAATFIEVA